MSGNNRILNLDRRTELELAVGYAKKLAENGSHPDLDARLLPQGAVKRAKELINYSYGHQIIEAYVDVLSSFGRFEEEMRVNNAKIANEAEAAKKNLAKVSGHVSSTIALVDEMFQNYGKIEPGEKKDVGALRSRFETTKKKAMQLSEDYDNALLGSDAGKVFEYGKKLSVITASATADSLWDVTVRLTHSVDDLMLKRFDDGTLSMLYELFVDSIISSLLEKGVRQVSE